MGAILTSQQEEDIIILKALSKEQIDELIALSREFKKELNLDKNSRDEGSDAGGTESSSGSGPYPGVTARYTLDPDIVEAVPRREKDRKTYETYDWETGLFKRYQLDN